jgi:hypothetical protein
VGDRRLDPKIFQVLKAVLESRLLVFNFPSPTGTPVIPEELGAGFSPTSYTLTGYCYVGSQYKEHRLYFKFIKTVPSESLAFCPSVLPSINGKFLQAGEGGTQASLGLCPMHVNAEGRGCDR